MYRLTITVLVLTLSLTSVMAQSIHQDKLSQDQLMKHYGKFPSSENIKWYQQEDLLQARFKFNGTDKIVTYSKSMKIIQEWTELQNIPFEVEMHLNGTYDQYKLSGIYSVEDKLNKSTFYSVIAKVKKKGSVIHSYNESLDFIENPETMLAINY